MKRQHNLLRTTSIALSAIMAAWFLTSPSTSCLAANKLALVVQASDYIKTTVDPLHFTGVKIDDASKMSDVLSSPKYGFTVDVIQDRNATHDKIMAALDKLAGSAQPDDAVVFYFSGHGANSNRQFTLCPIDALPDKDDNDIKEQDIVAWLGRLKARNVTLILDCCFTKLGGRALPVGFKKFIGRANTSLDREHSVMQIPANRAVVLSAAGDNGEAWEIKRKNAFEGLFTVYLALNLNKADDKTTYAQTLDSLKTSFRFYYAGQDVARDSVQTPTMYGSDQLVNRALFSPVAEGPVTTPDTTPPPPPPVVQPAPPGTSTVVGVDSGKITIASGKDANVTPGSVFALFPSGETAFTGTPLATVKVVSVTANQSVAAPADGSDIGTVQKDCRARLIQMGEPPTPAQTAFVLVRLDGPDAFKSQMKQELSQFNFVTIVADNAPAHLVVKQVDSPGPFSLKVLAPDGKTDYVSPVRPNNLFSGKDAASVASDMEPDLVQIYAMRQIYLLANDSPGLKLTLTSSRPQFVEGENGSFTVTADKDCWVYLIDIDPLGGPNLLFPQDAHENNHVEANKDLDNITPESRSRPKVLGVRWEICARVRRRD